MFYYVASPYTRFPGGLEAAFTAICRETALLMQAGIPAFSPIAHTHPIAKAGAIDPLAHDFWMKADAPMMRAASALIVVKLPTWDTSIGVGMEVHYFRTALKPVYHMAPGVVPAALLRRGYDCEDYAEALRTGAE